MSKDKALTGRYRWTVASRVAAAALGGYALTSAAVVVLAMLWPIPRAQAVLASSMLGFVFYTVAILWAFHARSVTRVWIGMVVGTAVLSALAWALGAGGTA